LPSTLRRCCALLALVLSFVAVPAGSALASSETDFVSRTNSARGGNGLPRYPVRGDLTTVARRQAARMAASRQLYHNPNLGSDVAGWQALGENVGRGGSVSSIQSAFMASAAHRDNILSSVFTEFGVGTAMGSDGLIYVSEVFRKPYGAATYVPPPPTRTAPRTVTRRASRGTRRAPLVVPPKPAPPRMPSPVEIERKRLVSAWRLYRRARPIGSFQRVTVYYRTQTLLGG
jgi:hypothetical protein